MLFRAAQQWWIGPSTRLHSAQLFLTKSSQKPRVGLSTMLTLGSILYVGLLLINAMAVLSEDRFLARSTCRNMLDINHYNSQSA